MTRSELISRLATRQPHLLPTDVDVATREILAQLTDSLARGERIEIRGFGSFDVRYRRSRMGRNPKTGIAIALAARYSLHFKPGMQLREQVRGP